MKRSAGKSLIASIAVLAVCAALGAAAFADAGADLPPSAGESEEFVTVADRAGLERVRENPSGCYVLTADIDLSDGLWTPFPFSGTLDGAGHSVLNLTVREPGAKTFVCSDGNKKKADGVYAGLFSAIIGGTVRNVTVGNADIRIDTAESCFAGGIAGYVENAALTDCRVQGEIRVRSGGHMFGAGGVAGFGWGEWNGCRADVTLIANNAEGRAEEYLGGILACGYGNLTDCAARLEGYAGVFGYAHNGGLVGMFAIHTKTGFGRWTLSGCSVDAHIRFFEKTNSRRAYCKAYIGEQVHEHVSLRNNETVRFEKTEYKTYETPLTPETCADR